MIPEIPSTLELLKQLNNNDLAPLVEYIQKASTETLTSTDGYKKYQPDHQKYVDEIYNEICLFGGNTIVNLWRKKGPSYSEVLQDVAEHVGVKDIKNQSALELEQNMLEILCQVIVYVF